ncbi:ABC transporter permease [Coralliovum pocilloporae]|uniref:ABC transporter permease n=1 Tax=Coralliovum pocilloporae TaxID=3066369 RepID=UPI003307703B
MLKLIFRRLVQMAAIMAVISLILFIIFDTDKFKQQIAVQELGNFGLSSLTEADYQAWLEKKGLNVPFHERFGTWVVNIFQGDFGQSWEKNRPVAGLLADRLANTGILAFWVFAILIPLSLTLGVLAGMKEGSFQDRAISFLSVATTSFPEIATAIILTVVFALGLGWLPGKSAMLNGFEGAQLVLPVATLVLYGTGYIARMTRASMAEVMTSQYIRTAILKGLPYKRIIMKHALRNALIAPFTVIVLYMTWLLSGVVVVEVFFEYDGFGKMILEAALFGDIYVIQAATLVAVFVAVSTQIISDIGYTFLNPRIRFS